ncbi:MAG TPA: hypothetical protein VGP48_10450 [Stellaceae bacterium]|jgi:hypothetical protein|nr:hypothetical protein [Stellaceae bacterium]
MKRAKILAATLAIAGAGIGLGAGASAVSAAEVICAPGYHFSSAYGCVQDMTVYQPSTIYILPPPAGVYPGPSMNYALGYQNGIDGGDHQHGDYNGAGD